MRTTSLVLLLLVLNGCCAFAKRSCFPECPPPRIVTVPKDCKLPTLKDMPMPEQVFSGCPDGMLCFNYDNSLKLAYRLGIMMDWIEQVNARCGKKDKNN